MTYYTRFLLICLGSALALLGGCGDDAPPMADADIAVDATPEADVDGSADATVDSAADASPDAPTADATPGDCAHCLDGPLVWGWTGGFVAFTDEASIEECQMFRLTRTPGGPGESRSCEGEVSCDLGDTTTMMDVAAAISDPAVVAAFASGTPIFGRDERFVDAPLFSITYNGVQILVGSDCRGGEECVAVPPELRTLVTTLRGLQMEMLNIEACRVLRE